MGKKGTAKVSDAPCAKPKKIDLKKAANDDDSNDSKANQEDSAAPAPKKTATSATNDESDEEEVIEYVVVNDDEEIEVIQEDDTAIEEEPRNIETGDSIKVKQVLDDAITHIVTNELSYIIDYNNDNWKLFLMFIACVLACIAQFNPVPFPESRLIVACSCGAYFFISGILQFLESFIDCNWLLRTKSQTMRRSTTSPSQAGSISDDKSQSIAKVDLVQIEAKDIYTVFDKYQEWFQMIITKKGETPEIRSVISNGISRNPSKTTSTVVGEMYIGKYFTINGDFDINRFAVDVETNLRRFEEGKYGTYKYDHKTD